MSFSSVSSLCGRWEQLLSVFRKAVSPERHQTAPTPGKLRSIAITRALPPPLREGPQPETSWSARRYFTTRQWFGNTGLMCFDPGGSAWHPLQPAADSVRRLVEEAQVVADIG